MTRAPAREPERGAALALLMAVSEERRMLSEAVEGGALKALDAAGRARAQRLAATTLRHRDRADAVLARHLRKDPPMRVRMILRLATVEMLEAGAPAHGVVNAAVTLTQAAPRQAHLSGLVNAVLRKVASLPQAEWAAMAPQRLPDPLRARLVAAWGAEAVAAMEAAHMAGAPLDLTLRDGGGDWAARLGAETLPTGSLRLRGAGAVSALPGYGEGAWWVQDAAAALPARVLAPRPGERVLDLCAAPGGKTLQLAAAGAEVTALDISAPRMALVAQNLARTGLAAECVVADALEWRGGEGFDAVLVDAPCTATGTIRRHPELPLLRGPEALAQLAPLQARMIDHARTLLRPGGRLVYCSCSLLPEEGEDQLARALEVHPELRADPAAYAVAGGAPEWRGGGGLRLRPDFWPARGGLDGFFIAAMRLSGG